MIALQIDSPMININFFNHLKSSFANIADDLVYKSVYSAFEYVNAEMLVLCDGIEKLNDIKYLEAIKQIQFDTMYDNHFETRDKIDFMIEKVKNKNDVKSKKLYKLLDELTSTFARYEWACGNLEHLIIEDQRRAS